MIWLTVASVLVLDQLSKALVLRSLVPGESVEVVKNIFYLTLVHNTGAAFGIFRHQTFFFIIVSVLAVIVIAVYIKRKQNIIFMRDAALALVLGGALGNLVDRLRFGYVVDFFDFRIWPVFNVADSAITIGTFLLIISLLKKNPKCIPNSSK
ncbi:signal peptidase II [Candidatus Omnitrophota bacterium]